MILKSIELTGFKSFAKKTPLYFSSPVTAIVGPNGSGKSNVVEAIRFVLGEQSIKSLRGKGGADLIFKGSKSLSPLSRASVSITFDNKKKIFSFSRGGESNINLDFDEITISREVFSDGTNTYKLNDSEVRLKDIIELVSSVHIGSSGHHIISQGEADRILNANAKDRRSMIEDALGLKVYQFRLKESERKLDKTLLNMKEVGSLRREIAPHLGFLKKQVEKIEKSQELRVELTGLAKEYFGIESGYIRHERERITDEKSKIHKKLEGIDKKLSDYDKEKDGSSVNKIDTKDLESKILKLRSERDTLARNLGRIEGTIEALDLQIKNASKVKPTDTVILLSDIETLVQEVDETINEALKTDDQNTLRTILGRMRTQLASFIQNRKGNNKDSIVSIPSTEELDELKNTQKELNSEIEKIVKEEKELEKEIEHIRKASAEQESKARESMREYYELKNEKSDIEGQSRVLALEEESLNKIQNDFNEEVSEVGALVGIEAVRFTEKHISTDRHAIRIAQEELHKKIERIKIKLEDVGGMGGNDVLKEYEEVTTRDQFLAKELQDIDKAVVELRGLIRELKETIDKEFKVGIEKINTQFQEFFSLMFGGGSAFLSVVVEHKRAVKDTDEEVNLEENEEDLEFERGIEINVTLPQKKVKDLNMLSGGERSLTSIALLFAMSQVNPPPFLVLDETDAALDEANSRKYGNMIENLSKYSQLIVVTHNRETMSRANVLYGVTIGSDGGSKLLSIKLEEAVQIAK